MAEWGLKPEHFEAEPPIEVWPDVWPVLELFGSLRTQWRMGPAGPYGLDYNVLYRRMDRMGLSPVEYDRMEDDVRVMEGAALDEMHRGTA